MLAKLRNISKQVNPYGGINFVIDDLRRLKLPEMIDSHFGKRAKQAKFSYSDIILGWAYANLCGAQRLEDTKRKYYENFQDIPDTRFSSPDRIAGVFKSFKVCNKYFGGQRKGKTESNNINIINEININKPLNDLLVSVALKLDVIKSNKGYTLDYDVVVIPTQKYDSAYSYKKCYAYSPAVAMIGRTPVYIEGRNGNVSPSARVKETLVDTFETLDKHGVKIKNFRSDAGGYRSEAIHYLHERGVKFFIRPTHPKSLVKKAELDNAQWEEAEINGMRHEITSIDYCMKGSKTVFRGVITRMKVLSRKHENSREIGSYIYSAMLTNDFERPATSVIEFYNMRGDAENNFSALLNDFNWRRIPFSFLDENTAFMIISAIIYVIYRHILIKFSRKVPGLYVNCELKAFITGFICVAFEWTLEGNEKIPNIYSGHKYMALWKEFYPES